MRITGTLTTAGTITTCENYPQEFHDDLNFEAVHGIFITADDETLRAASNLLSATVDIYPHPVNGLVAGECTPENYAHALARLAHAEDHLAREVRSSQALADATDRLQRMIDARDKHHSNIGQYLINAHKPGEVDFHAVAILDGYHVGDMEVAGGGQGEPGETTLEAALRLLKLAKQRGAFANTDSRDAAWAEYIALRKQIRHLASGGQGGSDEQGELVARAMQLSRAHNFDLSASVYEEKIAERDRTIVNMQGTINELVRQMDDLRAQKDAVLVAHSGMHGLVDNYRGDANDLREEVKRLRRVLHKHGLSADTSGEECDDGPDERGRDENGNALA